MAAHNTLGHVGEEAAVRYLEQKGYTICERNWRNGHLELDIVAVMDETLVVVEVKTRTDTENGQPTDAVDWKKRQNIIKATDTYLRLHGGYKFVRFDIVTVIGEADAFRIEHLEDVFHV